PHALADPAPEIGGRSSNHRPRGLRTVHLFPVSNPRAHAALLPSHLPPSVPAPRRHAVALRRDSDHYKVGPLFYHLARGAAMLPSRHSGVNSAGLKWLLAPKV